MSKQYDRFTSIKFTRFKAFRAFKLNLKHLNVLTGPNNSGKSTVLAAFRILAAALRKANSRNPEAVMGPSGQTLGYDVDLRKISIAEENIFFNYDDSEAASIEFKLESGHSLTLYFAERNSCVLIPDASGYIIRNTLAFKKNFDCKIGFVPILGPVEHDETLYEKETASNALYNYRAARNFRNIWHHFPEKFAEFCVLLKQTWPGMDMELPEVNYIDGKNRLHMYCKENRIDREIFWSGFGFQVWCQMLTHIIQNQNVSIFLIDEPDIYLHAELQRHLLNILKDLGPDIVIATHSTEMITEAELNDIVIINKNFDSGRRVKQTSRLGSIFSILGSSLNPTLTQIAKTRRVVFVEGKDFKIIGAIARKCNLKNVGSKRGFAVIEIEGFNIERMKNLKNGMEEVLGSKINCFAILDRDYRSNDECLHIEGYCKEFCDAVYIHRRKEIENYVLIPEAIERAIARRLRERSLRDGKDKILDIDVAEILNDYSNSKKSYVAGQLSEFRINFERKSRHSVHASVVASAAYEELEKNWGTLDQKINIIPGKDAIGHLNGILAPDSISITPAMIVEAMRSNEVAGDLELMLNELEIFSTIKATV